MDFIVSSNRLAFCIIRFLISDEIKIKVKVISYINKSNYWSTELSEASGIYRNSSKKRN